MNIVRKIFNSEDQQPWIYVLVQMVLLLLLVFVDSSIGPRFESFETLGTILQVVGFVGIIFSAVSIRSTLTPVPVPKENATLSTGGLYRYVRHPMYTSVLLLCFGVALASGSWLKVSICATLYALFYFKSIYEEKQLKLRFYDYEAYAKQTPRLIPFIKP